MPVLQATTWSFGTMDPKLVFVVFHLDRPLLEVVVQDGDLQRKIETEWANRSCTNRPPDGWFENVKGEVAFQRGNRQGSLMSQLLGPGFMR